MVPKVQEILQAFEWRQAKVIPLHFEMPVKYRYSELTLFRPGGAGGGDADSARGDFGR